MPTLPTELLLKIARECVPKAILCRPKRVGVTQRGTDWHTTFFGFKALNGEDFQTFLYWMTVSWARDDVLKELAESTVLRIETWEDEQSLHIADRAKGLSVPVEGDQRMVPEDIWRRINTLEISSLQLSHFVLGNEDPALYQTNPVTMIGKRLDLFTISFQKSAAQILAFREVSVKAYSTCSLLRSLQRSVKMPLNARRDIKREEMSMRTKWLVGKLYSIDPTLSPADAIYHCLNRTYDVLWNNHNVVPVPKYGVAVHCSWQEMNAFYKNIAKSFGGRWVLEEAVADVAEEGARKGGEGDEDSDGEEVWHDALEYQT